MAEFDSRTLARFWSKVSVLGPNDCWLWTAYRDVAGYGRFLLRSHTVILAHRFSFEINNESPIDGFFVCHHCDIPPCVNPSHLFRATSLENMRDMSAKGRRRGPEQAGESNNAAKLSPETIEKIQFQYRSGGFTQRDLATMHGVVQSHISNIVNKVRWSHL